MTEPEKTSALRFSWKEKSESGYSVFYVADVAGITIQYGRLKLHDASASAWDVIIIVDGTVEYVERCRSDMTEREVQARAVQLAIKAMSTIAAEMGQLIKCSVDEVNAQLQAIEEENVFASTYGGPPKPVPFKSMSRSYVPTLADTVCSYCGLTYRQHPDSLSHPGMTAICNKEPVRL